MVYCGQCGTSNPSASRFCSSCGAPLPFSVNASGPPTQALPPPQRAGRSSVLPRERKKASPAQTLMGCGCLLVLLVVVLLIIAGAVRSTSGSSTSNAGSADATPPPSGPVATDTPAPTEAPTETPSQWAQVASGTTFADARDHPDLHIGDRVVWRCTINKFLGTDASDATATDVSCGADGNTLSEFVIKVPPGVDTTQMHAGDTVTVYGTVDQPFSGTNGFGARMTDPQVAAVYVEDMAVSAQATADAQTAVAP